MSPPVVVVDLQNGSDKDRCLLLEALRAVDEGVDVEYVVLANELKPKPRLLSAIFALIKRKRGRLVDLANFGIDLMSQRSHGQLESSANGKSKELREVAVRRWTRSNISFLYALETFDEFVYLHTFSVPFGHGWCSRLVHIASEGSVPVVAATRDIVTRVGKSEPCGWSMCGWFSGRALRPMIDRGHLFEALENPWRTIGNFSEQRTGPGFCLNVDYLSFFDTPLDYLLYARYMMFEAGSTNPDDWRLGNSSQFNSHVMSEYSDILPSTRREPKANTCVFITDPRSRPIREKIVKSLNFFENKNSIIEEVERLKIPERLGGPRWSMLGQNNQPLEIGDLGDLFKGERCFIIGNGPSLNRTDLTPLSTEYTIGLNRIYLNYDKMGFQTSFLCVTNENVISQFAGEFDKLNSIKFLTAKAQGYVKNHWNTFFMTSEGHHEFKADLSYGIWSEGCTVTYCAMQVAFFLGFSEVILVGVDHGFSNKGTPHELVVGTGPDVNHFHPDYFGKGVKWQYPDLAGSEVSYLVARSTFEKDGRKIYDATIDGNLHVFEKVAYDSLLGKL